MTPEETRLAERLRAEFEGAVGSVRVPSAGQVWWRAAVRARHAAAHGASRPITWLQGIAAAGAIGCAIALLGMAAPTLLTAAARVSAFARSVESPAVQVGLALLVLLAACVVIAPVVLYLALSDD